MEKTNPDCSSDEMSRVTSALSDVNGVVLCICFREQEETIFSKQARQDVFVLH